MRYVYEEVPNGQPAVGGLSFSNGNCVEVIRLSDGSYMIRDTKLGVNSPVWHLTAAQFHALGRRLSLVLGTQLTMVGNAQDPTLTLELGDGVTFTMIASRSQDYNTRFKYEWRLSTQVQTLTFDLDELAAFCWGYHHRQFPEGEPLKILVSSSRPMTVATR